jgi:hypothetical protein
MVNFQMHSEEGVPTPEKGWGLAGQRGSSACWGREGCCRGRRWRPRGPGGPVEGAPGEVGLTGGPDHIGGPGGAPVAARYGKIRT